MERTEIVVVGAGAAGLAAAGALRRKRYRVVVLEARERIGGRVFTHREPGVPVPIELGAEFIHGDAPDTTRLVRDAGLVACDLAGNQLQAQRGGLVSARLWEGVDRVLRRIDPDEPDQSFARFLAKRPGGRALARDRAAARTFVQGYHAADLDRIGVHSLAPGDDEAPSASARRVARVARGYCELMRWLARGLEPRLATPVREIAWERGRAELTYRRSGRASRIRTRAVVVTVPLGVLQAPATAPGGLSLRPDPPRIRRAVGRLAMGSVVRLTVRFSELPWTGLRRVPRERVEGLGFLHLRGGPFNVWWTSHPMRWPLVVAWSGGPPAAALARGPRHRILDIALRGLAEGLGCTRRRVASRVETFWMHDWENDPYARGAYSYVCVGGTEASDELARPVAGTLFFAGEASDVEQQTGTVEGAIASGFRAARQVDRALSRS